jgi:YegS/Rv2252/BmrU family lipid kinase
MKVLVIYNEKSGRRRKYLREKIENAFRKQGIDADFFVSREKGDVQSQDFHGYDLIVASGGDGTVNQVANRMVHQRVSARLAILPTGSGNFFARYLDIPRNVSKAVKVALHGKEVPFDAGLVNQKWHFFVAAGVGYDAIVMKMTHAPLKRLVGFWSYGVAMIQGLFHFRETNFSLSLDGKRLDRHAKTIFCMNFSKYFHLSLGPNIAPDDGKIDIAVVRPVHFWDFFRLFLGLLSRKYFVSGRLEYFPVQRVSIHYNKKIPVQLDGENMDFLPPIEIKVVPKAILVMSNEM